MTEEMRTNDRAVIETGEPLQMEERIMAQGEQRTFLTTKSPVYDTGTRSDADQPVAVFGVASDITERKERKQELERERDRLDEFASVVSHDIRNPLNVADLRLDLLQDECDSPHIDEIQDAVDRMENIVSDVLWLAREGKDIGTTEAVSLCEVVEAAWSVVGDDAERATLDGTGTDLGTVDADVDRLTQALENLFRNAIEHGGQQVTVTVGRLDSGFCVADDGSGIPASDRDDVFDAGYSTATEGIGFGLRIVEQIVTAHDWESGMAESADGGARFEITDVQ
jgi:signal transduction histidine kinase